MNEKLESCLSDHGFYGTEDVYKATVTAIETILTVLPDRDRWCVEFGAWDGMHGSNTRDLIVNQGFSAVLIEADEAKFHQLQRNYAGKAGVTTLRQFVGFQSDDGLDAILNKTEIPIHFDFCCIDIDGNDYHVWKAMTQYQPKVLCIEFNPTVPPEVNFVQAADFEVNHGSSLAAIIQLGKLKGYELISVIGVNAFFVPSAYFPLFEIADNSILALWTKRDCVTYFFSGYDGQIFLRGCKKLPWHENLPIEESRVQALPAALRKYPYNRRRRIIYTCLTNPAAAIRIIWGRMTR